MTWFSIPNSISTSIPPSRPGQHARTVWFSNSQWRGPAFQGPRFELSGPTRVLSSSRRPKKQCPLLACQESYPDQHPEEGVMALGDGIRRNVAQVDPAERTMLRDAIKELINRPYPGNRGDMPPGGVSWWFKQDEIHQATHVHGGPEFLSWHRELTNRFEALLRQINPQLSLHYWDFKEDPRALPNANLGGGNTGTLNLFDPDPNVNFMGSVGAPDPGFPHQAGPIGEPWQTAGFYDPQAGTTGHPLAREDSEQPTDPPRFVYRPYHYPGPPPAPLITANQESHILGLQPWGPAVPTNHSGDPAYEALKPNYFRTAWETVHNGAHPYFANISPHDAFRDPFVFLLHSNVDRLFAMWQCDPNHPERLDPNTVYGAEGNLDVDVFAVGVQS